MTDAEYDLCQILASGSFLPDADFFTRPPKNYLKVYRVAEYSLLDFGKLLIACDWIDEMMPEYADDEYTKHTRWCIAKMLKLPKWGEFELTDFWTMDLLPGENTNHQLYTAPSLQTSLRFDFAFGPHQMVAHYQNNGRPHFQPWWKEYQEWHSNQLCLERFVREREMNERV